MIGGTDTNQFLIQIKGEDLVSGMFAEVDRRVRTSAKSIKDSWASTITGINQAMDMTGRIIGSVKSILNAAEEAAAGLDIRAAFDRAFQDGDAAMKRLKASVDGTLSEDQLEIIGNRFAKLGLGITETAAAVEFAYRHQLDTGKSLEEVTQSIARVYATGSDRGLKLTGITLDLKSAYDEAAKAAGMQASELDDLQKKQIRAEEITRALTQQNEKTADSFKSEATEIRKAKAEVADLWDTFTEFSAVGISTLIYSGDWVSHLRDNLVGLSKDFANVGVAMALYSPQGRQIEKERQAGVSITAEAERQAAWARAIAKESRVDFGGEMGMLSEQEQEAFAGLKGGKGGRGGKRAAAWWQSATSTEESLSTLDALATGEQERLTARMENMNRFKDEQATWWDEELDMVEIGAMQSILPIEDLAAKEAVIYQERLQVLDAWVNSMGASLTKLGKVSGAQLSQFARGMKTALTASGPAAVAGSIEAAQAVASVWVKSGAIMSLFDAGRETALGLAALAGPIPRPWEAAAHFAAAAAFTVNSAFQFAGIGGGGKGGGSGASGPSYPAPQSFTSFEPSSRNAEKPTQIVHNYYYNAPIIGGREATDADVGRELGHYTRKYRQAYGTEL